MENGGWGSLPLGEGAPVRTLGRMRGTLESGRTAVRGDWYSPSVTASGGATYPLPQTGFGSYPNASFRHSEAPKGPWESGVQWGGLPRAAARPSQ